MFNFSGSALNDDIRLILKTSIDDGYQQWDDFGLLPIWIVYSDALDFEGQMLNG